MLQSEEHPWVPAGLAASVVMLVAASAREVIMRRAWTRHVLEENSTQGFNPSRRAAPVNAQRQASFSQTEALRGLEQKSKEADAEGSLPESHLKVFQLCGEFLEIADTSLASPAVSSERRITVRARQERVRALQKHHMLLWARDSARLLTHQAHQQARLYEKIESANRALDCIDTALKSYPDNEELRRSGTAVREFMTSSRVAHWVELAQRASFKGRYRRAIDCYRDALFYLTRAGAEHQVAADQITREIEMLRARMKTAHAVDAKPVDRGRKRRQAADEQES
jgi:tetratricopeptide (TPR) repeat protein